MASQEKYIGFLPTMLEAMGISVYFNHILPSMQPSIQSPKIPPSKRLNETDRVQLPSTALNNLRPALRWSRWIFRWSKNCENCCHELMDIWYLCIWFMVTDRIMEKKRIIFRSCFAVDEFSIIVFSLKGYAITKMISQSSFPIISRFPSVSSHNCIFPTHSVVLVKSGWFCPDGIFHNYFFP